MTSSSPGGVVATFPPGPGTAGAPFFLGNSGPGNFAESRPCVMSLTAKDAPLLKPSPSRRSGVAPLLSGWTSISRKDELRLGGAGAFFFFFFMRLRKPLPRVLSLSLGIKRSSSFRLLSRKGRSFRGSMGDDTATSGSNGSEEVVKMGVTNLQIEQHSQTQSSRTEAQQRIQKNPISHETPDYTGQDY
ncbi:hypothetical protein EYF80_008524 [Liparis tanakae]|uniref:Uncharacterized protein n=1 Tax=Liparis tanakae TaxID=230148 RepID=A0A4Z2IT80_9TELE|nr:hypothetical protein EYF80_008524 [Liparis tanakae]